MHLGRSQLPQAPIYIQVYLDLHSRLKIPGTQEAFENEWSPFKNKNANCQCLPPKESKTPLALSSLSEALAVISGWPGEAGSPDL